METNELASVHARYLPAGYRKRNVFVSIVQPGARRNVDSYWQGGSRDYFTLHRNGQAVACENGNQGIGTYVDKPLELQAGDVLVRTGVFCGKTSTATVTYCR